MTGSLPSINPATIHRIKVAIDGWGTDAEFLAKFAESVMKITNGSGYGTVRVYIKDKKVELIKAEETHAFKKETVERIG